MHPESPAYLTPPMIAREISVKVDTVGVWIRSGELPAINTAARLGGRPRYKVARAALEAFLARRAVTPAPKATTRPRRQRTDSAVIQYFR